MLTKKHIEFEDIDGFKHEMDVYFHLSFDDVVSLFDNGLQEKINKLSGSDATLADQKAVIDMLLRKSYGFRRVVNDIPTFVKGTDEEWEFFKSSGAYDSVEPLMILSPSFFLKICWLKQARQTPSGTMTPRILITFDRQFIFR